MELEASPAQRRRVAAVSHDGRRSAKRLTGARPGYFPARSSPNPKSAQYDTIATAGGNLAPVKARFHESPEFVTTARGHARRSGRTRLRHRQNHGTVAKKKKQRTGHVDRLQYLTVDNLTDSVGRTGSAGWSFNHRRRQPLLRNRSENMAGWKSK